MLPRTLVAERKLVDDSLRDRASVCTAEQTLALEQPKVPSDRRGRDVECLREPGNADRAVLRQPLEDRAQTLRLLHRAIPSRVAASRSLTLHFDVASCAPQ